ncbi:MAG: isoaspartyl peptidase/L-asparaginase family protein, partial [Pyrinomonadaceae bacterium]
REYRARLNQALVAGYEILKRGDSSLDAVEAAIKVMEDSPLFNAGKGAAFTSEGTNELDAAIMDGKTLKAGGVAGLKHVRNPISLARLVLDKSPHVLMVGDGAEAFAREQGVELVSRDYFYTDRQWKSLLERRKRNVPFGGALPPTSSGVPSEERDPELRGLFYGTVGAVALDRAGNLAAGTSTGGRVNKKPGRVGDSPIIGAGTYANNESCAVSTTGLGEFHMRLLTAREIAVLMTYKGMSLQDATVEVLQRRLVKLGGGGGAIAIDRGGNVALEYTDNGMYRGYVKSDGKPVIKIYQD